MQGRLVSDEQGNKRYAFPCDHCGEGEAISPFEFEERALTCDRCREAKDRANKETRDELKAEVNRVLAKRRLHIALEIIERQGLRLSEYEYAIEQVKKRLYNPGWFQSSNEVLTALELIRCGVKARHQVKMGRWRVDFLIPDWKVVLEIDNRFFHDQRPLESRRDAYIIAALGGEWEIVRINDDLIRRRLRNMVGAIKSVVANRRKLRKMHGGQLPLGYHEVI